MMNLALEMISLIKMMNRGTAWQWRGLAWRGVEMMM